MPLFRLLRRQPSSLLPAFFISPFRHHLLYTAAIDADDFAAFLSLPRLRFRLIFAIIYCLFRCR